MDIHDRIKELREDRDITQEEIARILGTTRQQVYKYEAGKQDLNIHRLKELCLLYGVSADYILGLPKGLKWPR